MSKYLAGAVGALAGLLALKLAHKRGFNKGIKASILVLGLIAEGKEDEES